MGKGVEMIMLGLDLFPGYDTYTAADIPVTGVLPILPGDYTANALFLGGGNTTTTAAMAGFAVEELGATTPASSAPTTQAPTAPRPTSRRRSMPPASPTCRSRVGTTRPTPASRA